MEQLSAYEQALVAESNPAHVRLFLFICQRLQEKDVDCHDLMEKSDPFAGALMGMLNENSTGYNRAEVAILFDHFMKWYTTPYKDYSGEIKTRKDINFYVDYAPESDFADILRSASAAIKEKRGADGPKMPRSWGVGMKCSYRSSKGHSEFERHTIDHHGRLLKVEPWEKFFQTEDPADEAVALSLEPKMPWMMKHKFFYRTVARECNLTAADAPAILATDNYYFGEYLYKSEENVSAELKYLVFRADSLTKDSYLAKDMLRGPRSYSSTKIQILLALPTQTVFSHSKADINTYCPILGMLVKEAWYMEIQCKLLLAEEQRQAFALGFVEASAIAISRDERAFQGVVDTMNSIFSDPEKAAIIQLLVKQLRRAPQTDNVKGILGQLQSSKAMKMAGPEGWDLPLREIEFVAAEKETVDPLFWAQSTDVQKRICEEMGFTIASAEKLVKKKMWGFVHYLFSTSRSEDLRLVDRVWLKAIDDQKKDIISLIYEQGYPIHHAGDRDMDSNSYGDHRNPFANMLKTFPSLVLKADRTKNLVPVPDSEDYNAKIFWCVYRQAVIKALTDNIQIRTMHKYLERSKALLDKLFGEDDAAIKKQFFEVVKYDLQRNGHGADAISILEANWPKSS